MAAYHFIEMTRLVHKKPLNSFHKRDRKVININLDVSNNTSPRSLVPVAEFQRMRDQRSVELELSYDRLFISINETERPDMWYLRCPGDFFQRYRRRLTVHLISALKSN